MLLHLDVHGDARGWFKQNWQRSLTREFGFTPVQQNVSFNQAVGTTRGFHAEPWDKLVSVATGRALGAWVDLRPGPGFGRLATAELEPGTAVLVPRGVANAFQTLEPDTAYTYLVSEEYAPDVAARSAYVNLADPTLAVPWPVPLQDAVLSAADRSHPFLADVTPVAPRRILVLGAGGQLGRALMDLDDERLLGLDRAAADLTDPDWERNVPWPEGVDWRDVSHVINAAAFTGVDAAETSDGERAAWAANASAVTRLTAVCAERGIRLVHVSTDYVLDGTAETATEDAPVAPLNAYGASKAAGEAAVLAHPDGLVVRTSWVYGQGRNFVATMARLAASPDIGDVEVVADQVGRITAASELAAGLMHLIDAGASGLYHLQGEGEAMSWHGIAKEVFAACGADPARVRPVSTDQWAAAHPGTAARPARSVLGMSRLLATGFTPRDHVLALREALAAAPAGGAPARPHGVGQRLPAGAAADAAERARP